MLFIGAVLFTMNVLHAQKSPVYVTNNIAINGYDAVAYFKEHKPVKGTKNYLFEENGVNWYFSSQANLDSFKTNPEKFMPQFGGYCAYGLSQGHKAPTDPDAWTIVDDKLYLNYNKDVQKLWKQNQSELIKTAENKWPELKDKE